MVAQILKSEAGSSAEQQDTSALAAPLKICHVSMTLKTGGLERLLVEFGRFHNPKNVELTFVSLADLGPPADDLRAAGFEVQTLGMPKTGKIAALKSLRSIFRERNIDVVHTHNTYPHFYGAIAARWAGVQTVINTQHGRGCGSGWKSLWQFRIANRLASRVVGVSEDATNLCRGQDRPNAKNMITIWNGIDLDRFAFHGPRLEPIAISVARLSPEKDYATLFRALPHVIAYEPRFKLLLVGDGSERQPLEKLADELGIRSHIEFLGERKDVSELLKTAGFFVSSSKTEGISLTLLEAMAVGLPIVTTRVGGNPEIVVEGETGKLVPSQNPEALADAICRMLDEHPLWPTYADAARARAEQHFSARTMVKNYESLYRECYLNQF
ncbi:glycosyltransferase [Planctomicrobium sp. SH527]|uniref:glycosyltransferase n=1 Tax=Planctomicrobium sp. SH527 TaxID=3448123 RepID=UPI003F5C0507